MASNSMLFLTIKAMLAKLENQFTRPTYRLPMRQATPTGHYRPISRQNHSAGESKTRRRMAARSNRINRERIKRWKH